MKREDAEEFTQSLGQIVAGSWRQIALAKRLGVPKALGLEVDEWVQSRLGGYVKMSIAERREAVAELAADGQSTREIAEVLGTSNATVARDLEAVTNVTEPQDEPAEEHDDDAAVVTNVTPLDAVAALAADDKLVTAARTSAAREEKERQKEERREENRKLVTETPALATVKGKFATIVIDPPWDWGDEGDVSQLGRARPDYNTVSIEELKLLPVWDRADVDCHLYLWITNRSLPKGFSLLDAWGFRYVTCITWVKPSFGMGNYFRGQTEHVLFGVKGSQLLRRKDVGTVFSAPRGPEHSSKPGEFFDLVETCSPGPYLNIYARGSRTGWVYWGAEADAA